MAGVNPIVLIQMLMQYHNNYGRNSNQSARIFTFARNGRMITHKETPREIEKRKSRLDSRKVAMSEIYIRELLKKRLSGKLQTRFVWIDPKMKKIAVPLQMSTGENGFGILPTGSRIDIPEGKFIRAFTYWEKVNDIDLSCFALTENGFQQEFSWRNMFRNQGEDICFSGDQTSGYKGGSEFFDIDIDLFKQNHPEFRYIVFNNNVYSGINFSECDCKAGFMIRETDPLKVPFWKGQRNDHTNATTQQPVIFDPKTVQTSFRINAEAMFAHLFAIDLEKREMVWLNIANSAEMRVAGCSQMEVLLRYLTVTDVFNVYDLYSWAAFDVTPKPEQADIVVSDDEIEGTLRDGCEWIHSWDFEKMLKLLA